MLREVVRHADRRLGDLALLTALVLLLDAADPLLELADVLRVEVQAVLIGRAELAAQTVHLAHDPVEDAAIGAQPLGPLLRRAAGAEELLEDRPRIADHRERLRRRRPADRVGVGAGVAVRAAPGLVDVLDAELHRRDRRLVTEPLRVDLVERSADEKVGALRLLRMRLREEHRRRAEVVTTDLGGREGVRHPAIGVADDRQVLPERLERAHAAERQIEVLAFLRRGPESELRAQVVTAGRPVNLLDAHQARAVGRSRGFGGMPRLRCRNHGIEKG